MIFCNFQALQEHIVKILMENHPRYSYVDYMERKELLNLQRSTLEVIWNNFCKNLQEKLMLQTWTEEDLPSLPQEQNIWKN